MQASSSTIKAARPGSPSLIEAIRQAIHQGELVKGDRLSPVRQLASQYGLSFETVRSALQVLERDGLIVCRQGSGCFVTYEPQTKPAAPVGLDDVALWLKFRGHVFQHLADELLSLLQEQGRFNIHTAVWQQGKGLEQLQSLIARWGTDSPRHLVLHQWETPGSAEAIAAWLASSRVPTRVITVFSDPRLLPSGWHSVSYDPKAMGRMAAEYLLERGHRRIGFVTYARLIRPGWKHTLRKSTEHHTAAIQAVGHAMRERDIHGGLHIHYVTREVPPGPPNPYVDPPAEASTPRNQELLMQWLKQPDRPTAVIGDDTRVMGVKVAAERLGLRVPEDLELVGFGNTPWSVAGQFPTVAYGEELVARQVVRLIEADEKTMDGTTMHLTVPPHMVIR